MGTGTTDRPWRRNGVVRYAVDRVRRAASPPVRVVPVGPDVRKHADVEVAVRDGTILRANVYRPASGEVVPALLCAHPYGKDTLPARRRRGGYRINPQYRALRQPAAVRISAETGWEAPDPGWWVPHGFAVVNLDVRGAGRSDGTASLLSQQEADDIHDVVEWIAAQPWCDGNVAMIGVSYLAISQYRAATTAPPHLRAIVPWEGFTDAYHDLFYPGGVPEVGFSRLWTTMVKRNVRLAGDLGKQARRRRDFDAWWQALAPDLARIEVPMLVCGSFSDNNLHSRGSFRAFAAARSRDPHLYTHRGGKWATFYSEPAKQVQLAFLENHLKGADHELPRVRLEVRDRGDHVHAVRDEQQWPPEGTRQQMLWLAPGGHLQSHPPAIASAVTFDPRRRAASFGWTFAEDTELVGPMRLLLRLRADRPAEAHVFAGVSKWSAGRFVPFEGSYGFGRDLVTTGWRRAEVGPDVVETTVDLGPSATLFRAGETLRLHVAGRQLSPRNPLFGAAPALYRGTPRARWTLDLGPDWSAGLEVPVAG